MLWKIERFLERTGMSATQFGREAAHDPRLVFDLRRGRLPGPALGARIERYLDGRR